jgi:hypothetical protein
MIALKSHAFNLRYFFSEKMKIIVTLTLSLASRATGRRGSGRKEGHCPPRLCRHRKEDRSRYIKFIYSENATNICEISTVDLSYAVAFSEYMNFIFVSSAYSA